MGEGAWLVGFLVVQRGLELAIAARNTARLRGRGAVEFGAGHYPVMVALHATWLVTLAWAGYDRPVDVCWLGAFLMLQAARVWVIASLGRRWTTRILVLPGAPPVSRGPYRWLRHPNYLVVALEIAVVPLALGLPWVALAFTLANAVMLAWRIRLENQVLAWAVGQRPLPGANVSATLAKG
ncbi:hypothetical protein DW352_21320 [Pseudolabrys taiwanensis]|uniref:Isoprenylcysteine carboxyl methyltransferase n=1 Tax=Pseudolabrys taiwanensis TaxID=331696 RepID=A0A346A0Z1_9HYPH|nr:isoprenylcysteine carboxylmethyltransferase family protein [Pseudolabrys taiwanensis]AXK82838.1 hypothetical protein DW352_21320 [Pseudolabrys taiwanensis]